MKQISTIIHLSQIRACWPGAMILSACPTLDVQTGTNTLSGLIKQWRKSNVVMVITLLEKVDHHKLDLVRLVRELEAERINWRHFPIPNMKPPVQDTVPYLENLVEEVASIFANDSKVVIHCHAGLGRTGLVASILLTSFGMKPEEAIATIRMHRPGSIETHPQEEFVFDWNFRLPEFPPGL